MAFKFPMKSKVKIVISGESGTVIGRAEYATGENNYRIRYTLKNGVAVERWWTESALTKAS